MREVQVMTIEEFSKRNARTDVVDYIIDRNYTTYQAVISSISAELKIHEGQFVGPRSLLIFSPHLQPTLYEVFRTYGYRTYEDLLIDWPSDEVIGTLNMWHPDLCIAIAIKNLMTASLNLKYTGPTRNALRTLYEKTGNIPVSSLKLSKSIQDRIALILSSFYMETRQEWTINDIKKCFHEKQIQMTNSTEVIAEKLGAEFITKTTIRVLDRYLSSFDIYLFPSLFYSGE